MKNLNDLSRESEKYSSNMQVSHKNKDNNVSWFSRVDCHQHVYYEKHGYFYFNILYATIIYGLGYFSGSNTR